MNEARDWCSIVKSAVMSGVCVGIAGFGYMATRDIVGSVLFAFALLTVVNYKLLLYTGTAGFIRKGEWAYLFVILLGNIVGCGLVALLARLALGPLHGGLLSIACGFIMTTAVTFARKGNNLPLLFGVPLFIVCGFPHCIADAFYYLAVPCSFWAEHFGSILLFYVSIVLGNFIGCNFYRLVMGANPE